MFEVKPYESEVKLKKNVVRQLEHGVLFWGMQDNELVIPLVAQNFINPKLNHVTWRGESESVPLTPGNYVISCVSYEQKEISRNPEEVLSESAYFNPGILAFTIRSGSTTTIRIVPRFRKTGKIIKVFVPALYVSIFEGDEKVGEARDRRSFPRAHASRLVPTLVGDRMRWSRHAARFSSTIGRCMRCAR